MHEEHEDFVRKLDKLAPFIDNIKPSLDPNQEIN